MNKQILFYLFLFTLFCPAISSFAETAPSSVRDLIVIGLEQNIGLQVEALNVPVAAESVVINDALFDAELFATTAFTETATPLSSSLSLTDSSESSLLNGAIGIRKFYHSGLQASLSLNSEWNDDNSLTDDLDPRYRTSLSLLLTQPLLRNSGKETNTTSLRIASNQLNQTELQHHLQAQLLALQVELLAAQLSGEAKIVELRSEAVGLARDLLSANQRRFDTGVIPISEVQEAETALANRELNLSQSQQTKELNFTDLNRQLGHSLPMEFAATELYSFNTALDDVTMPDPQQLFPEAREKNLALQLAELDISNAVLQQNFYQNQLQPQLDLNLLFGLNGLSGEDRTADSSNRYAGTWLDSLSSAAEADGYQWGVGLEFSLPLGNRSAKSKLRQAKLINKQAKFQELDLEEELRRTLQLQTINLKKAVEQVKIAERFEKLARLSLAQEQRRLDEGLSDTFRIISFQDNMISAKIGRINAVIQYFSSVAQMNFTRGITLERHNIQLSQHIEENSHETM